MAERPGRASAVTATIAIAIVLSAGNLLCHVLAAEDPASPLNLTGPGGFARLMAAVAGAYGRHPAPLLFHAAAPLLAGFALAFWIGRRETEPGTSAQLEGAAPKPEGPPPSAGALRLLALLQQEGRLIDFLEEDIAAYDDAQVGAAVRDIHGRCRAALRERMRIERIYAEEDGATVEIRPGFDPALVRLTGNVHGEPPFRGTLQHAGWRATDVKLPAGEALDPSILAPAEVEIP
jgi:hypothetical protein